MKMKLSTIINPEDLDTPISFESVKKIFKKGKIRGIILYEDNSIDQFWFNLKKNYQVEYKKRVYLVFPKCILHGKVSTVMWYFNNPCPILFQFTKTLINSKSLKDNDKEIKKTFGSQIGATGSVYLDGEALKSVLDSNIVSSMYRRDGLNAKSLIIILVVISIIILVFLQIFGVVDVYSMISGNTPKTP